MRETRECLDARIGSASPLPARVVLISPAIGFHCLLRVRHNPFYDLLQAQTLECSSLANR